MATVHELLRHAVELHNAQKLDQAERLYREVLASDPHNADALHLLGVVAHQAGHHAAAVDLILRALQHNPNLADAHYHVGSAYRMLLELEKAVEHLRRAVEQKPTDPRPLTLLGATLIELGALEQAVFAWQRLTQLEPNNPAHFSNLGTTYERLGQLHDAIAVCQRALALNPNYPNAHNNLGAALAKLGRLDESVAAHDRAVALRPDFAEAWTNLASTYQQLGQLDAAMQAGKRAVHLRPDDPTAHRLLAMIAQEQGRLDEARAAYDRAIALYDAQANVPLAKQWLPRLKVMRALMLPPVYSSSQELEERRGQLVAELQSLQRERLRLNLDPESAPTLFSLAYQGRDDKPIAQLYANLVQPPPVNVARQHDQGKIHVAFISRFFRDHTIGRLNRGLIAKLDRSRFRVTVFSVGDSQDSISQFCRQHADAYVALPPLLPAARDIIARHAPDVLFYTDIGMDPITYGLAFSRLAPVQCVTWGHPVTTGIPTIDYFISSDVLDPPGNEAYYTEKLTRLKNLAVYYYRPALPSPAKTRRDFNLPDDAHLYACLQMLWKFHPDFDPLLADILSRDSKGLLLLVHGLNLHWDEMLMNRFRRTMPNVVDRVRFLPRQNYRDFLTLTSLCDVSLDPTHFGGGNTTYESLAFNVPVITLPSPYLRGRLTLAMYEMMNMHDCVAKSHEDYVERAVSMATDPDRAQHVREKIAEHGAVLFQNEQAVRELEQFLQDAHGAVGLKSI
jgi:predicted O-linked N-acetylglucosamine transferase (SPINDLY family)